MFQPIDTGSIEQLVRHEPVDASAALRLISSICRAHSYKHPQAEAFARIDALALSVLSKLENK